MIDDNTLFGPVLKDIERTIFKIKVGNLSEAEVLIHMKMLMHPTAESITIDFPDLVCKTSKQHITNTDNNYIMNTETNNGLHNNNNRSNNPNNTANPK